MYILTLLLYMYVGGCLSYTWLIIGGIKRGYSPEEMCNLMVTVVGWPFYMFEDIDKD